MTREQYIEWYKNHPDFNRKILVASGQTVNNDVIHPPKVDKDGDPVHTIILEREWDVYRRNGYVKVRDQDIISYHELLHHRQKRQEVQEYNHAIPKGCHGAKPGVSKCKF